MGMYNRDINRKCIITAMVKCLFFLPFSLYTTVIPNFIYNSNL